MKNMDHEIHPFINYLIGLSQAERKGALADLRRGLGQTPGTVVQMYRYIVPWLPKNASRSTENAYYLVASLVGLHPASTDSGNLGDHMAKALTEGGEDALERRFTALLSAHEEDLPDYLRQSIGYLKSKDIPVNWDQLFSDIQKWQSYDRRVQKAWARSFWTRRQPSDKEQITAQQTNE